MSHEAAITLRMIANLITWISFLFGTYAAILWWQASRARVDFKVGDLANVMSESLQVEITQAGLQDHASTNALSGNLNARAAEMTAISIGLQAVAQLINQITPSP